MLAAVLAATCVTLLGPKAQSQSAAQRSTRDGVFSAPQVERGRETFLWECMDCHEMEEFTGVGAYLEDQDGATVWDVFGLIWNERPEHRLEPDRYADVLAYMLRSYGLPFGDSDLPTNRAALEDIRIAAPELPDS